MKLRFGLHVLGLLMIGLFSLPLSAWAALEVSFSSEPLFSEADVKPGDAYAAAVTVTNTGPESEMVQVELTNTFSDGLAEVLELAISSSNTVFYQEFLTDAFAAGEIPLETLAAGETAAYELAIAIAPTVGNEYELTNTGFNVRIGFSGGVSSSDTPSRRSGGSGGGGSRVNDDLAIFNEQAAVLGTSTVALEWNTNLDADSYAVCGAVGAGPYTLTTGDPLLGYQFMFDTDTALTENHRLVARGLDFGVYECRVASREERDDPYTISPSLIFELAPDGQVAGASIDTPTPTPFTLGDFYTAGGNNNTGGTGGKGGLGMMTYEEFLADIEAKRALASSSEASAAADETASTASGRLASDTATDDTTGWPTYGWLLAVLGVLGGVWVLVRR